MNARPSISIATGRRFTRGMDSIALAFNRGMQDPFAARFWLNHQSQYIFDARGE
jgi:hypothetical protein